MTEKFGIEIEFLGLGSEDCAEEHLPEFLFEERCRGGLGCSMHHDGSVGDCEVHGSVTDECFSYCVDDYHVTEGAELVTRPMKVCQESFDEVRLIFMALEEQKCWVNDSCGIHVHVDASFLQAYDRKDQVRFFEIARQEYAKYENIFDARMDASRRGNENEYCRSMLKERSEDTYSYNRYYKLNTASFVRHGTIEFRQHHGSMDCEEVIQWVKTCILFMHHVRSLFEGVMQSEVLSFSV